MKKYQVIFYRHRSNKTIYCLPHGLAALPASAMDSGSMDMGFNVLYKKYGKGKKIALQKEMVSGPNFFSPLEHPVDKIRSKAFGLIWEEPFDFVVRFDKEVAYYVKGRFHHPTQQIEDLPDGGVLVRIRAGGWDAMKYWIMSFTTHAEVIQPETMREEMLEHYRINKP